RRRSAPDRSRGRLRRRERRARRRAARLRRCARTAPGEPEPAQPPGEVQRQAREEGAGAPQEEDALIAGGVLVGAGLACAVWGARAVSGGSRPLDLVGALAAAMGVLLAGLGGVALLVPRFLG